MKKLISVLLTLSLLLSLGCMLTACNGDGASNDTTETDSVSGEETTVPNGEGGSLFDPSMNVNEISLACSYDTTTYELSTLLPENGELTVAAEDGTLLDSTKVKLKVGTNVFQVLYTRGYAKKAYCISIARRDTYRVLLNTNGGSYIAPLAVADGTMLDLDKYQPTRGSGYTFAGWYLDGEQVTGQQPIVSDRTFVAHWTAPKKYAAADSNDAYIYTTSSAALNIVWKDYDNAFKVRPNEVLCTLKDTASSNTYSVRVTQTSAAFVGSAPAGAVISQGAGNWTVKITGLTGNYSFVQNDMSNENYTALQSGTSVVNTYKGYAPAFDDTAWLTTANGRLYDYAGNVVTLKGVVTHNVGWADFESNVSIASLMRLQKEGVNCIRVTLFVETEGNNHGYHMANGSLQTEARRAELRKTVKIAIDNASSLGMYCIVDWGILASIKMTPAVNATAKELFVTLATEYKDNPFVIYEICNEPEADTWSSTVVPYAEDVIAAIREQSDALVILAPDGSSSNLSEYKNPGDDPIDKPINTALAYNVAYTFHCYAATTRYNGSSGTYYGWKVKDAIDAGLTLVLTEFSPALSTIGTTSLTINEKEANKFLNVILENDLNVMLFRYMSGSAKDSAQYMFRPNYSNNLNNGTWTYDMLQSSGKWFYDNALNSTGFIKAADFSY